MVVSTNYFGRVALLEGLQPALARSGDAAVVLGSTPDGISLPSPVELAHLCLDGAEDRARTLAHQIGAERASGAGAAALARYVRRHALTPEWSLDKDAPEPRPVERPASGRIVQTPLIGSLHHRYSRRGSIGPDRRGSSATLTSTARGCPSRPRLPFPPAGRVFGPTVFGNALLGISVLPQ
jgi:hypothetical protein